MTARRTRKMPPSQAVHEHWVLHRPREAAEWFGQYDLNEPSCYACGWWNMGKMREIFPEGWACEVAGLDRSHLVDFARGGEENFDNLVLLCSPCNQQGMPSFGPEEYDFAVDWVRSQPPYWVSARARAKAAVEFAQKHGRLPGWLDRDMAALGIKVDIDFAALASL